MSLLKNIFESVLNEIGADDAYNRFYSSIPRDKYDEILDGNTNVDKFMQFILNGVRDDLCDAEDAVNAMKEYRASDPLIRQKILNNFREGEYESALDILTDIKYLRDDGGVISRKKFAKSGYVKLGENDEWLVTSTVNYAASNHYFGDTHWCTASDREGDYDGYKMFKNYTFGENSILVQYSSKSNKTKKYQIQWREPSGGENENIGDVVGQICDFNDHSVYSETVVKDVNDENLIGILTNKQIYKHLERMLYEQKGPEEKYQERQDKLLQAKRERRLRKLKQRRDEVRQVVDAKNEEQGEKLDAMWNEAISSGLYKDSAFISEIYERDCINNELPETEEEADESQHIVVSNIVKLENNIAILEFGQIVGTKWYDDTVENDNGDTVDYQLYDYFETYGTYKSRGFYAIVAIDDEDRMTNLLSVGLGNGEQSTMIGRIETSRYETNQRFVVLYNFDGKDCIFDTKSQNLYPCRRAMDESTMPCKYFEGINGDIFIVNGNDMDYRCVFSLTEDGKYDFDENCVDDIWTSEGGGFLLLKKDRRLISGNQARFENCDIRIPEEGVQYVNGAKFLGTTNNESYIAIATGKTIYDSWWNVIMKSMPDRYIFGKWGDRPRVWDNENPPVVTIRIYDDHYNTSELLFEEDFTYRIRKHGSEEWVPCNKYGKTKADIEKERITKKNFSDWQAQGGHSPEAKAEMDKMYKEHGWNSDNDIDGSRAMNAWNNDDVPLPPDGNSFNMNFAGRDTQFTRSLQTFPKDDRWGSMVGLKDPMGYNDDMTNFVNRELENGTLPSAFDRDAPSDIRRNPWYRIGKDGKPLDQPWYDEDEVPARLSDRVVRENKIKKEYNNMISIMERMGLIEE